MSRFTWQYISFPNDSAALRSIKSQKNPLNDCRLQQTSPIHIEKQASPRQTDFQMRKMKKNQYISYLVTKDIPNPILYLSIIF